MVGNKATPNPPLEMGYRSSENFSQPGADRLDLTYGDFRPQDDLELLLSNNDSNIVAYPTHLNSAQEREPNSTGNGDILSPGLNYQYGVMMPIFLGFHLGHPEVQTDDEVRSCFCFDHETWADHCVL
jgi:hypothetical protein